MKNEKDKMSKEKITFTLLIVLELAFFIFLFVLFPFYVIADFGQDNVTVKTFLDIGNTYPEILNITINDFNSIDLTPNSTTNVTITAVLRDFNGDIDIEDLTAEFFDPSTSGYGSGDDNNNHYTNNSCTVWS
jgi:hypothetical protein